MVAVLLKNKANPNAKFDIGANQADKGVTPLVLETYNGRSEIIRLLLQAKADPNLASDTGRIPILEAVQSSATAQRKEMTQLLLEHGANPNVCDSAQVTPLMKAVFNGEADVVELLLTHKADVNAKDNNNRSPLHYAAWALEYGKDMTGITEILIRTGAEVNLSDGAGRTPLKWAESVKTDSSTKIAAFLREHGGLEKAPRPNWIELLPPTSLVGSLQLSQSTNHWNRFTFLKILAMANGILTSKPQGEAQSHNDALSWAREHQGFGFPNLEKVRIRRPAPDLKSWQDRTVDVSDALASGDCSKDSALEWGDVVEVTQADHPLNQDWPGFSGTEWANLKKCLSREVEVIIKGQSTKVTLAPGLDFPKNSDGLVIQRRLPSVITMTPFWIKPALRKTNLLLASSDLAHIRVKRVDPKTGAKHEWTIDCSDSSPAPDFWLRDGDVIEVPDKT